MGLLEELASKETWLNYLAYKKNKGHLSRRETTLLSEFIQKESYQSICEQLLNGDYHIAYPEKKLVNKQNSSKKRVVYQFPETELRILKVISHLLYRYDNYFSNNLYSFRTQFGAKKAITSLASIAGIDEMYGYKLDVSN